MERESLSFVAGQDRPLDGHHGGWGAGMLVLWFFIMWLLAFLLVLAVLYAIRPTQMAVEGAYYGQSSCDGLGKACLTALWLSLIVVVIVALIWWSVSGFY